MTRFRSISRDEYKQSLAILKAVTHGILEQIIQPGDYFRCDTLNYTEYASDELIDVSADIGYSYHFIAGPHERFMRIGAGHCLDTSSRPATVAVKLSKFTEKQPRWIVTDETWQRFDLGDPALLDPEGEFIAFCRSLVGSLWPKRRWQVDPRYDAGRAIRWYSR